MPNNSNHPKKGSIVFVEPIRTIAEINEVKNLLRGNPRDYALFVVGINTALRASDLLSLKVGDVKGNEALKREKKTGKVRRLTLNNAAITALEPLLVGKSDDDLVFVSRKTKAQITVPSLNNMVKEWCRKCCIKGNFGSHSLRKTFGCIQRTVFNAEWEWLRLTYGHSNILTTQRYLGIQPEEIERIYMNEI